MTDAKGLTGRHVLAIFLAFFVTVMGVNTLMVTYAISSFSGEDVPAAYVKGLNYNQALAQRDAEARSGYAVTADARRRPDGAVEVVARVTLNGAPPPAETGVTATLRHPTNAHLDETLPLAAQADGTFAAAVPGLPPGQWDLVVIVERDAEPLYEARARAWLP